ncbi:MAG: peptidylprolyl isomerase [Candidatus Tectomicrobia bacterium]|nr:peptidylprolyl isomerase [Candidatus Tectomicrobia bacterium]
MKFLLTLAFVLLAAGTGFAQDLKVEDPAHPVVILKTGQGDIYIELFSKEAPKTVANFVELAEGRKEFTDPKTGKKAKRPFYDGLTFHRVIKDFMIQGGDPNGNGSGGPGYQFEDEINADALGLGKLTAVEKDGSLHPHLLVRGQEDFNQMILIPLLRKMKVANQEEFEKRKEDIQKQLNSLTLKGAYENMGYSYSPSLKSRAPAKGVIAMANAGPNTNGYQFFISLADTPWLTGKHTVFGKVVKGMEVVEKIGQAAVGAGAKPAQEVKILSIRLSK